MKEREETWHRLEKTAAHNAQGLPLPYPIGGPITTPMGVEVNTGGFVNF